MSVFQVSNADELSRVINSAEGKLVVVDYFATWCGPCHAIAGFFNQLAIGYASQAIFVKVDVEAAPDVAQAHNITSMPTFHFIKGPTFLGEIKGANPQLLSSTVAQHV